MTKQLEDFRRFSKRLVEEFIVKFEASTDPELWERLVVEEAREVLDATTPAERLKEVCDFAYVCAGRHIMKPKASRRKSTQYEEMMFLAARDIADELWADYGSLIMTEAFTRVHQSNMSKLGDDGKPIRRADGKILKSNNYKPPYLDDLINNKGE